MTANFRLGASIRNSKAKAEKLCKQEAVAIRDIRISQHWYSDEKGSFDAVVYNRGKLEIRVGCRKVSVDSFGLSAMLVGHITVEAFSADPNDVLVWVENKNEKQSIQFKFRNKAEGQRFIKLYREAKVEVVYA